MQSRESGCTMDYDKSQWADALRIMRIQPATFTNLTDPLASSIYETTFESRSPTNTALCNGI